MNIIFTPGEDFENLLSRATFNPVPSRSLQNAALKAEKKGEKTIDIEAVKNNTSSGGADNSGKPSNSSGTPGSSDSDNPSTLSNQGSDSSDGEYIEA